MTNCAHFLHPVRDLAAGAELLARPGHGWVEVAEGRLVGIWLRPWPRRGSWLETRLWGAWLHQHRPGDRVRLYFNQFRSLPSYLSLAYARSNRETTLATLHRASAVMDEIARLRRSDALVADFVNARVSDRLLRRWGWEPLPATRWRRPWIKRFYGVYPASELQPELARCGAAAGPASR